ncbi:MULTISPECIES: hypothetical protein [Rhodococcus]|uniref:hypothetical protein n=1 Tax=Rhodococcus TaxID=1827 RepID=UPI001E2B0B78|nr:MULTISPECIES: hypothetical protein [Rhodococcus]BDB59004.1 hypothetical protein RDE2_07980 [Rhodococcus sp. RDE2]
MAVTAKLYGGFLQSLAAGEINLASDTLKAMLCTSAYTPNQDTHRYKSSVTGEVTGTGYTAGGKSLTGVTVTYDAATNRLRLDSDDPSWPDSTITCRYLVFYDATPASDATRPLIAYVDFGADVSTTAGTFTAAINAAGIATITAD